MVICQEQYSVTKTREVVRCDKCCRRLVDKERVAMSIVTFNRVIRGTQKIKTEKYHLCEMCAFDMQNDMDMRRERIQTGVSDAEQEFLLKDLFNNGSKRRKRC